MLEGKWNHMWVVPKGICAKYQDMPHLDVFPEAAPLAVDINPVDAKKKLEGCMVVNLADFTTNSSEITLIDGIGYDWKALRLGNPVDASTDASNPGGPRADFEIPAIDADSVTVIVSSLPFFRVYEGKSTSFGISFDGSKPTVVNGDSKEYTMPWKYRVEKNGVENRVTFPVKSGGPHKLTLTLGDPGMIIQRVILDWGGLKPSDVGPAAPSES